MHEPQALLAADTDQTQAFVFESSRLPEIRGASRMLDDLNEWAGHQIPNPDKNVIFCAGGMLLALVPLDQAEIISNRIRTRFPQETLTATTTVAWRPVTEEMLAKGYLAKGAAFASLRDWVGTWLQREKESRAILPWLECPPYAERCASCRKRPAQPEYSFTDRPLCIVCHKKYRYEGLEQGHNAIGRDYWFAVFQEFLQQDPGLQKRYYASRDPFPPIEPRRTHAWVPNDLSEIGQASKTRSGYIGYIYLDGDNMGHAFKQVETAPQATALSKAIEQAARQTVLHALAKWLHPAFVKPGETRDDTKKKVKTDQIEIHPFEIITIGGDDVTLIVPASVAIPLACEISQQFAVNLQQLVQAHPALKGFPSLSFTLSGGVVLADDHNPVNILRELGKDLAKSAKQARYKSSGNKNTPAEGFLDFVALTGTDIPERDLDLSRKLFPYQIQQRANMQPLSLLGRPYPVSRLSAAWQALHTLKEAGFANSQMSLMVEALYRGVQESSLFYQYQQKRDFSGAFTHLDAALTTLDPQAGALWQVFEDRAPKYGARTAFLDLAEMFAFV